MNKGRESRAGGTGSSNPPGAKVWVKFKYTSANGVQILASYNVSNIVRNGTGDYTITFSRPFLSRQFVCMPAASSTVAGTAVIACIHASDTGSNGAKRMFVQLNGGAAVDPNEVFFAAWGDQ